jgi:hypothetical protein
MAVIVSEAICWIDGMEFEEFSVVGRRRISKEVLYAVEINVNALF